MHVKKSSAIAMTQDLPEQELLANRLQQGEQS